MTSSCDRNRELLAAECAAERPWSAPLEEHLASCEECAQLAQRWVLVRRALRSLRRLEAPAALEAGLERSASSSGREERALGALALLEPVPAPSDLDGRVVAALQDGFRQDRASDEMQGLEAVRAPGALDGRIDVVLEGLREEGRLADPNAPRELEQRVDSDLRDLPAAITRGAVQKLPRKAAPGELDPRVEQRLVAGPRGLRRRPRLLVAGLAAAAALVLWVSWPGSPGVEPVGEPQWSFRIEYAQDLEALSPVASQFAHGFVPLLDAELADAPEGVRVEIDESGPAATITPPGGSANSGGSAGRSDSSQVGGPQGGGTQGAGVGGGSGSGASAPGGASTPLVGFPRYGPDYFNATGEAPFVVAYRGDRHVLTRTEQFDIVVQVEYVEEVASDGQGNFTVVPTQLISPMMDAVSEAQFMAQQAAREGFFYRFRDFRVRNLDDFWRNYDVQPLSGQTELVAGRTCERFDVQRKDGTGNLYRVLVDPETSLVMSEECLRPTGELVHRTWFASFALDADLSDLQLTGGPSQWIEFDPLASIGAFNEEVLIPSAPPTGYESQSTAYAPDPTGTGLAWSRFVYGDGLEQVYFLCEDVPVGVGNGGAQTAVVATEGDFVRVFSFGEWTMVEGEVARRYVLAVGKVDEQELLLMLQSAVE